MAVTSYEIVRISGDNITPSLLVWRRYKRPAPGMLGLFLDINPQLARALGESPYLPVGVLVKIPIDDEILSGKRRFQGSVPLWRGGGS